jgi:pilus assembly protein CpaE
LASGKARRIFVTASAQESLIEALRAGAKGIFPQPIKIEEIRKTLEGIKREEQPAPAETKGRKKGKIIHVLGCKGGVGTTTIAVNLAICLKELDPNLQIALVDLNLFLGATWIFLDLASGPDLGKVLKNISRMDTVRLLSSFSRHPSGVSVLPSPWQIDRLPFITPERIRLLLSLMHYNFDYIFIDGGKICRNHFFEVPQMADSVLLVTFPIHHYLRIAKKTLMLFRSLGYLQEGKFEIVISRYIRKSSISPEQAEQIVGQRIIGLIPNHYQATMSALEKGKSLAQVEDGAEIHKSFQKLALWFHGMFESETQRVS